MGSRVEFGTHSYQFEHGKMPRGVGCWAFDFGSGPRFAGAEMSLVDAKKLAKQAAKIFGLKFVVAKVCP